MRNLIEGIHRFQRGMFGAQRDLFRRLVDGQEPDGPDVADVVDPSEAAELPALRSWLAHCEATRRLLRSSYRDLTGDALLETAVEENVLVQIEHLRTHPSVIAALARGSLTLHAWLYDIAEGDVYAFDPERGQYVPIEEAGRGAKQEPARLSRRQI